MRGDLKNKKQKTENKKNRKQKTKKVFYFLWVFYFLFFMGFLILVFFDFLIFTPPLPHAVFSTTRPQTRLSFFPGPIFQPCPFFLDHHANKGLE